MISAECFFLEIEEAGKEYFENRLRKRVKVNGLDLDDEMKNKGDEYQKARKIMKSRFTKGYNKRVENIEAIKKGKEIKRGVMANSEYIESLIAGEASTGVCWTWNNEAYHEMNADNMDISIELTAELISEESINEVGTFLLGFNYVGENEIRLKYNQKILLKSLKIGYIYNSLSGNRKYQANKVYQINKIVETGNVIAQGDQDLFNETNKIYDKVI